MEVVQDPKCRNFSGGQHFHCLFLGQAQESWMWKVEAASSDMKEHPGLVLFFMTLIFGSVKADI